MGQRWLQATDTLTGRMRLVLPEELAHLHPFERRAWLRERGMVPRVGGGMPFAQYDEKAILDAMFGNCVGQVNQTVTAPASAQTALTVRGSAGSGSMDVTQASGNVIVLGTPGSGATQNQYSAPDILTLSGSQTGTSLAFASQTIGKSRAVGDFIFQIGTTTAPLPAFWNNTLYIGLTTQAVSGATQANVLSNEPTSTGGYARIVVLNNVGNWPAATAAQPSVKSSGATFSFPASSAAWSTGSTNLIQVFIADASTLAGGNVLAFGALTTPQAVNASAITLSFASAALTITLT